MNVENVTTEDYDPDGMKYRLARISLTDITPSQLESIVVQLRDFGQHPPKKDLIFDGAIKVVNTILFPPKQNEIILKHPDRQGPGRQKSEGGHYEFKTDIVTLLKERDRSTAELRRKLVSDQGMCQKEVASFYVALRKLRKDMIVSVNGDYLTLNKENHGPRQGV